MADIVVVGGGLTGAMMAITLSHSPFSIAHLHPEKSTNDSIRTTTINAAGKNMLAALGVWQHVVNTVTPIHTLKVADGAANNKFGRAGNAFSLEWHDDAADRDGNGGGGGAMAYVVGNDHLLNALDKVAHGRPIETILGKKVVGLNIADDNPHLGRLNTTSIDGRATTDIGCQLVVGCDGRNSTLRQSAGIKQRVLAHSQTAIVAVLEAEKPHDHTAFQRFLRGGPFALMPMEGNLVSLVWTLPKDQATELANCDNAAFEAACQANFGDALGGLALRSKRLLWPLQPSFVLRPAQKNLVLAGDAAHAIHPLAGQGYNLALGDAAVLLDVLCDAHGRGLPAGHLSVLADYVERRRTEVGAMSLATSGLNALFSAMPSDNNMPLGLNRIADLGMRLLNKSSGKSVFSDIAKGGKLASARLFEGKLPR